MKENKSHVEQIKQLNDELKSTTVLYEDLKVEKKESLYELNKVLEESELTRKKAIDDLRVEHELLIDSMIKDHTSIVDDLKRSKTEAIDLVKIQHTKRMSDVLTAKDEEHKKEMEERNNQLKILKEKEEMMKITYSEKVKTSSLSSGNFFFIL